MFLIYLAALLVIVALTVVFVMVLRYEIVAPLDYEPTYSWKLDHAGGGVGAVLGLALSLFLTFQGRGLLGLLSLVVVTPLLGAMTSLLTELAIYSIRIRKWRSLPGADKDVLQDSDADVPLN